MKQTTKRILALLLAAALLFPAIACKRPGGSGSAGKPETISVSTDAPDGAATATPQPTPEATPNPQTAEAFAALDLEMFRWYVTDNGFTFHSKVKNPDAYGISRSNVNMTWGDFSEEATRKLAAESEGFLARLTAIARDQLSAQDQLSYDVLRQYLEMCIADAKYEYYYEPLTEYSGLHSDLPLTLALFEIESAQDAEDYLALLADLPRYLGQVLAYEQERAGRGLFMTEHALDAVLDDIETIIDSKDDSFLYATFRDAIDAVESISDEQAKAFQQQNDELIRGGMIDAYRALYEGLKDLRGKCGDEIGVCKRDDAAKAYFALRLQQETDNLMSVDESYEMIKSEMFYCINQMALILEQDQQVLDRMGKITSGSTETDIALLKQITEKLLPELPAHTVTFTDVPEELEDMLSPAAYVIPPVDDGSQNEILINLSQLGDTYLLTLAHEAYPGHMYQYVYQRGLSGLGLMQRTLHYGGYAEGWSQLGEFLTCQNQTTYDKNVCNIMFYNNMLSSVLLPATVSLLVNNYDYEKTAIRTFLEAFGITDDAGVDYYWRLAIEQPYYTFCYAAGYSQLMQMIRGAQTDLGKAYDQEAFLKAYLDLGPAYFNLVQERMDVWVDERMQSAA